MVQCRNKIFPFGISGNGLRSPPDSYYQPTSPRQLRATKPKAQTAVEKQRAELLNTLQSHLLTSLQGVYSNQWGIAGLIDRVIELRPLLKPLRTAIIGVNSVRNFNTHQRFGGSTYAAIPSGQFLRWYRGFIEGLDLPAVEGLSSLNEIIEPYRSLLKPTTITEAMRSRIGELSELHDQFIRVLRKAFGVDRQGASYLYPLALNPTGGIPYMVDRETDFIGLRDARDLNEHPVTVNAVMVPAPETLVLYRRHIEKVKEWGMDISRIGNKPILWDAFHTLLDIQDDLLDHKQIVFQRPVGKSEIDRFGVLTRTMYQRWIYEKTVTEPGNINEVELSETSILQCYEESNTRDERVVFRSPELTLPQAVQIFRSDAQIKAILITDNGRSNAKSLERIITPSDIWREIGS